MPDKDAPSSVETAAGATVGGSGGALRSVIAVAVLLIASPVALIVAVVLLLLAPWWVALVAGLLVGAAVGLGLVWYRLRNAGPLVVDRLQPGSTIRKTLGIERAENLIQGLALGAGVEQPELVLIDDPACNAMAVRNHGRNWIAATTGLLDRLDVVELEGVVAELLVRLRNGDAEAATTGAALLGLPILDGPLSGALRPLVTRGFGRLFPEDRDLSADRQAVALTRYPPGLLSALRRIENEELSPRTNTAGLDHMWLIDPAGSSAAELEPPRADLDLRIDVLAEL